MKVKSKGSIINKPKSRFLKRRIVEFSRKEAPENLVLWLAETDVELSECENKLNHIKNLCEKIQKSEVYILTFVNRFVRSVLETIKEVKK
ncbi:hypothetical protein [Methanobrevibacter arboriphilus]|uniref:Uncharacterized protein n=1 Tax=Methanobrevibacter arboriphilus TaxID=39441 RepID=A0ACA8R4R9_METAZ|nr:hypothetical protein [Methanobrevibacter arboriphilus]BBL62403.1 hypothetical protein MarbSA_14430 [Methanobrevibacter arboriphilus]